MTDPIQTGTVGMPIRLVLLDRGEVYDPNDATLRQITVTKPDGSSEMRGAEVGQTEDGRPCLEIVTQEGDLDQPGLYYFTGYIEDAAGRWPSAAASVYVHRARR